MTIEIIEEEGYLETLKLVSNTSGGCSASTRLATVRWPDGEEADTFIKIFPISSRNREIINESFGLNINEVIELCISKEWKGFKIEWYNNLNNQTNEKSTTKDRGYDPLGIYN